jgi:hypothetical protein
MYAVETFAGQALYSWHCGSRDYCSSSMQQLTVTDKFSGSTVKRKKIAK